MTSYSVTHLDVEDGVKLAVYSWPGPTVRVPKASVQIAHGLAEHCARYDRLAQALTAAGYVVYASDHRGHGKSVRDASGLGFFSENDGFRKLSDDLYTVNNHIAARHPGLPRILLAHSFGSFVAQNFLFTHGDSISAVALSGTNSSRRPLVRLGIVLAHLERLLRGKHGKSKLLQFMTFGTYNTPFKPPRTEVDWLSRDPAEVDKYVADPLCGFDTSVQGWADLFGGLLRIVDPERQRRIPKRLPIYIFSGAADPVGEFGRGTRRLLKEYEQAGLENVTSKFYPEARHELFNETNRDEVTKDLITWLDGLPAVRSERRSRFADTSTDPT